MIHDIYLEAELNSVQIYGVWRLYVAEALSVGVHSDLLPQLESLCDVLLPDALDAEVGELHGHVFIVDVHGAHPLLAAVPTHTGGADQVVGMSLGVGLTIMGDTADHHHGGALVAADLDLGESFLVRVGSLPLERSRAPALAFVAEPQLMGGGLLQDSHKRLLVWLRLRLGLQDALDVLAPVLLVSIEALDVVSDIPDGPGLVRLHGLQVEGDGLVLALDSVRVNLNNLEIQHNNTLDSLKSIFSAIF